MEKSPGQLFGEFLKKSQARDFKVAIRLLEQCAWFSGSTQAEIAAMLLNPSKANADHITLITNLSTKGHAIVQHTLGQCYEMGYGGLPVDQKEAIQFYRLATDQNYSRAQCALGRCYERGLGVPVDPEKAVHFYRLAADQGFAHGQNDLGVCYRLGYGGLPVNQKKAIHLYRLAADQGFSDAQHNLGICYAKGIGGLSPNLEEAVRLYRLAADQGHSGAQEKLGLLGKE